jgi:hypothetical protein
MPTPREQALQLALQAGYGANRPAKAVIADAREYEAFLSEQTTRTAVAPKDPKAKAAAKKTAKAAKGR